VRDLRKDHDKAIREVCSLRRKLDLFSEASVAIDGSKFKAVNARDKNLTEVKMKGRFERIDKASPAISLSLKPPIGMAMRQRPFFPCDQSYAPIGTANC
jgi:hypothetical protein